MPGSPVRFEKHPLQANVPDSAHNATSTLLAKHQMRALCANVPHSLKICRRSCQPLGYSRQAVCTRAMAEHVQLHVASKMPEGLAEFQQRFQAVSLTGAPHQCGVHPADNPRAARSPRGAVLSLSLTTSCKLFPWAGGGRASGCKLCSGCRALHLSRR